ncbi:MAG: FtsX-like permease family protein [Cytophagales bacterium]|nr:FtsX-like permease family protein [Cytophagales bacterium]
MKLAFQIAYKNLMGAGLRTWLNVAVLSFAFVMIIFFNGLMDGWNQEASRDSIAWEYGQGQLLHENYDPYDPFSLEEGHGVLPSAIANEFESILIQQGSIYPDGRMLSVQLKGINLDQNTLKIPTPILKNSEADIPVLIGKRMAETTKLKEGDEVLLRWRDINGTFDAANLTIAGVFDSNVGTIDNGQLWMPLKKLQSMTGLDNQVTLGIAKKESNYAAIGGWKFQSKETLLKNLSDIIATKKISSSIFYLMLLAISLLALFDTQVLSIFRRQKEIGTFIALGMTRQQVVGLFTVEGSMYSLFAIVLGAAYGTPMLWLLAKTGIPIPAASQDAGVAISDTMYPVYGFGLIAITILLIIIAATIVSFLPATKIAKLNPVNALKGKIQ